MSALPRSLICVNAPRTARWPLPGDPHATVGTRHHLLPQLHQRYFGSDQGRIATVERATGRRYVAPISDTVTERDFYTALDESGAKDGRSDQLLARIEADAAPVIRQLVTAGAFARFPPSAGAREAMCWFLAFQKIRGRASRKKTELLGDAYMHIMIPQNMSAGDAEEWLRARDQEPTPEAVAQVLDLSASVDETEFVPDPNAHIAMMAPVALKVFEELVLRRWYMAEYAEPSLVTCDEPVVLVFEEDPPRLRGVGLVDAAEVWFPLSPRHLLVLAKECYGTQCRVRADPASARDVNRRIAANAYESIHMHPDHDHLAGIDLPEPGPLFEIHAPGFPALERYNNRPTRTKTQRR